MGIILISIPCGIGGIQMDPQGKRLILGRHASAYKLRFSLLVGLLPTSEFLPPVEGKAEKKEEL